VGHWWGFGALLAACYVRTTWGIDIFWHLPRVMWGFRWGFEIQNGDHCSCKDFWVNGSPTVLWVHSRWLPYQAYQAHSGIVFNPFHSYSNESIDCFAS